jgi:ribosomal protein L31
VVDDIDNLCRGDGTRRRGKRERRIEKFKHRFGLFMSG